jgi:hypothetical protein
VCRCRRGRGGKGTTLAIASHRSYHGTGLPTVAFYSQRGFKADPRAVATECPAAQVHASAPSCPRASKVGSGGGAGFATVFGTNVSFSLSYTTYLGVPRQRGDLASIVLVGTLRSPGVGTSAVSAIGRVIGFGSGPYGLEILIDKYNVPSSTSSLPSTLTSFNLSAGAFRTVTTGTGGHRHTRHYALVTNPPRCSGAWSGKFIASFAGGASLSQTTTTPCTK